MQCSPSWWFQIAAFSVSITGDKEQLNWIVSLCINFLLTLSFQHCSSLSYSRSLSPSPSWFHFLSVIPQTHLFSLPFRCPDLLKFPSIYVCCHHSVCVCVGGGIGGLFIIHTHTHTCCGCVIFNPVQFHWCSLLALYLYTWLVTLLTKQRKKKKKNRGTNIVSVHLKVKEQRLEVLLKGKSVEEIRVWVQDEGKRPLR